MALFPAHSADEPARPWEREGWGLGVLPAANYNPDDGFGFGVTGSVYRYDGSHNPYAWSLDFQGFATTRGFQNHFLNLDVLGLAKGKLRVGAMVAYVAIKARNFCGLGSDVTCDPSEAEEAAEDAGLEGEASDTFVHRYYLVGYRQPTVQLSGRYELDPMPHKAELLVQWRGYALIPGTNEEGAYAGSLYDQTFPGGEEGFASIAQIGLLLDNRDFERAPTRGYRLQAKVSASDPAIGSEWSFVAPTLSAAGFQWIGTPNLVLCDRVQGDGVWGEPNLLELPSWGGYATGRGIRSDRFVGKVRLMQQAELRWTFARTHVSRISLDFTVVGFSDLGFVATDWDALHELGQPLPSQGGGLRVEWDRNFIVRLDLGFSALESWSPWLYIDLGNVF
jgi:hypothetical protein